MNSMDSYLLKIKEIPLLTPEEEFELAVRYSRDKDMDACHRLVASNLRLVVKVAFEYKPYGVKIADLIQEGNIGLIMAVKKFDPYKGYRLSSYAVWWIRACIQNFIMRDWSLVKIGTTQAERKLFYKIGKIRKALESGQENEERYEALSKDLDVSRNDIVEMEQRMSSRDLSLDATVDEGEEITHLDLLQGDAPGQEQLLVQEEEKRLQEDRVARAMDHLNRREFYIIQHRIMDEEPLTLREIGKRLKVSKERVRQIESRALKKLKGELRSGQEDLAGRTAGQVQLQLPVGPEGFSHLAAPPA